MSVCEKHDQTMTRLFDDISEIKENNAEIKTMMTEVKDFKNIIHKTVFGNGGEGLISKINRVASQTKLQWGLFVALLVVLAGALVKAIL